MSVNYKPTPASSDNQDTANSLLSQIQASTDNIPLSPSEEHVTAASPSSVRLSDGSSFLDPRSIRLLTSADQVTIANSSLAVTVGAIALPTGASTAAKQPAIGSAGSASADVLTIQGIASMIPLKVDGSGFTQPVSGSLSISNFPSSQAVTGTFWQSIQPVSGTVAVSNFPSSQAVTGTFWQSTQPVSIATMPSTPVTGTFWQPTQPVSVASMPSTPVTGTFWQSMQPVSGPLTDAQIRATPVPVSGTVAISTAVALDATLTGGTQKAIVRSAAKGTTTAADVTSTNVDVNTQALDVSVKGTVPVSGIFWQATQPVSGSVSVSNFPASQAVTGTFWQATQPVSGPLTDTQLRASAVPVSGTVTANAGTGTMAVSAASLPLPAGASTAAKQPALGTAGAASADVLTVQGVASMTPLKVDGSAVTQPVSGTFFQATQPVSIASMPSTPVTGTFWQATQPVSGTFFQTTQPISAASLPLPSGASTETTLAAMSAKLPATLGQKAMAASQAVVIASDQSAVPVTPPTLTKGTQAATGLSIQALKDAGRNQTNYFMAAQIVSTATDTLMSLTGYKGGVAVAATTTPAVVTAAKTYRIVSATIQYVTIVTTPGAVRFTLRANLSGVVAITSPAVASWEVGEPTSGIPVAGKFNTIHLTFADGIEFAAGTGIGVSMVGIGATGAAAVVGYGKITLHGYEY